MKRMVAGATAVLSLGWAVPVSAQSAAVSIVCGVASDRADTVAVTCPGSTGDRVGVGVRWQSWGGAVAQGRGFTVWNGKRYAARFVLDRLERGTFVDAYRRLTVTVAVAHPAALRTVRRWTLDGEDTLPEDPGPPPAAAAAADRTTPAVVTPTTRRAERPAVSPQSPTSTAVTTTSLPVALKPTQTLAGIGNASSAPIDLAGGLVRIAVFHGGTGRFRVRFVDARGREGSTVVNVTGSVETSTIESYPAGRYTLKVEADGAWRFDIDQPTIGNSGQDVPAVISGRGLAVVGPIAYAGAVKLTYEHFGTSSFTITPYLNKGKDSSLVNGRGHVGGAALYRPEANYFLRVDGDGAWTIALAPL